MRILAVVLKIYVNFHRYNSAAAIAQPVTIVKSHIRGQASSLGLAIITMHHV